MHTNTMQKWWYDVCKYDRFENAKRLELQENVWKKENIIAEWKCVTPFVIIGKLHVFSQ